MSGGKVQVIVHDVSTDQDVATVDVPGAFDGSGWAAPPVALSGDLVYVGTNDGAEVVNWRTGQTHPSDVVPGSSLLTVHGGRVLIWERNAIEVRDAESGKVLLHLDGDVNDAVLSPDGHFAVVSRAGQDVLYDLESGATSRVSLTSWGWSSNDDEVFGVQGSTLTTCSTTTGQCRNTSVPRVGKDAFVRYAGSTYES
jgi:hypothetical protein